MLTGTADNLSAVTAKSDHWSVFPDCDANRLKLTCLHEK